MRSFLIITLSFFFFNNAVGQSDNSETMNILDEKAAISHDLNGQFHYLINVKSSDSRFDSDAYKFLIPNQKGFGEFYDLKEVGEVVFPDTINYKKVEELEGIPPCDLHDLFSEKKQIFLLSNRNDVVKRFRIIYRGTQKNLEMLQYGF